MHRSDELPSPPFAGWTAAAVNRTLHRVLFVVERMDLTDRCGALDWSNASIPRTVCEILGSDGAGVLSAVVARDAGVELAVCASYVDGQAVTIAQHGSVMYALRAVPQATF